MAFDFNLFEIDKKKPKRQKITKSIEREILMRQGEKCAECDKKLSMVRRNYHIDHKKAIADGGSDTLRNMHAICLDCHNDKTRKESRKRILKSRKKEKKDDDLFAGIFDAPTPKRGRRKKDPLSIY